MKWADAAPPRASDRACATRACLATGAIGVLAALSAAVLALWPSVDAGATGWTAVDGWRLKDGTRCQLRPVTPQDAGALGDMVRRLSGGARRNRFHAAVNALSAETLRRMTHVDHRHHVAFVVTRAAARGELVVADARYVVDADGAAAEFALVVDDRWQRQGVGARALAALCDSARRAGLGWLYGSVLSTNSPMLALMQRCHFCCIPDPDDARLVHVEQGLGVRV
jgi:acetyltransferase